ncbi:MAG: serine/threonine-protein kinase, partial [Acidimicrobiales bacterium]
YRIEEVVAWGGFAVVYRARDLRLDSDVAMKVLAENHAFDAETRARFADEARALKMIEGDKVVTVFDIGETPSGQPYLVMDFADRGTLADRMGAGRVTDRRDVERVASFLADALGAMHDQRLVHRDVKPSNILIRSGGGNGPGPADALFGSDERLVLADLGLVKDLATGSAFTAGAGSEGYSAPEQLTPGSQIDERTDIFGASVVVAQLLTGWRDDSTIDPRTALETSPHKGLAGALLQGLSEDPDKRQSSMEQWIGDVEAGLGQWAKPRRVSTRMRWLIGAVAAAIVAAIVIGGWPSDLAEEPPPPTTSSQPGTGDDPGDGSTGSGADG